jgi:isopenicillin-N N-acyltransferase-like protein
MPDFPHIRVEGSPRERGRQYGEQARDRVRLSIDAYREVFASLAGWDWERVTAEARRFEAPIEAYGAKYAEELRGIAEGASAPLDDVLAINVRTEIMFSAKARLAAAAGLGECSSFAALPGTSADATLVGQNWDWLLHTFDTVVVLEARQDDGPDYVTVVEAGLLAKTGMSSSGIGLATNALATDADRGEPGVPYHVLLRAVLDAETITDALAALQRAPRSSSAGYLVAHDDGLAAYVEAAPGDFSRLFLLHPEDGLLLHTNHFLSERFHGKDVSLWAIPDSPFRLERLRSLLAAAERPLSVDTFESVLSDHAGYPSAICCHPDVRHAPHDRGATVVSAIMELDERRLWLSDGSPCETRYRELDYADFLSKPSPVQAGRRAAHVNAS